MREYKCKFCEYKVMADKTKKGKKSPKYIMGEHYDTKHKEMLPPDMDGYRFFYYLLTGKDHGSCVMCHNETEFNRNTMKFARFCSNPQCKQKYKEERDKRMIGKYGKLYVTDDPEMQRKMLEARKISGTYTWTDGKKFGYVGSYEKDFLHHLDIDLKWPSSDLMAPSPHTYTYTYDNKQHFYIPDIFIPSMALELEIKSRARSENQTPESRAKEIEKQKLMESCSNLFSYLIIWDKDYRAFEELINKEG